MPKLDRKSKALFALPFQSSSSLKFPISTLPAKHCTLAALSRQPPIKSPWLQLSGERGSSICRFRGHGLQEVAIGGDGGMKRNDAINLQVALLDILHQIRRERRDRGAGVEYVSLN